MVSRQAGRQAGRLADNLYNCLEEIKTMINRRNFIAGAVATGTALAIPVFAKNAIDHAAARNQAFAMVEKHDIDVRHWRGQDGVWRHKTEMFGRGCLLIDWPDDRPIAFRRNPVDIVYVLSRRDFRWDAIQEGDFVMPPVIKIWSSTKESFIARCEFQRCDFNQFRHLAVFRIANHWNLGALVAGDDLSFMTNDCFSGWYSNTPVSSKRMWAD